MSPGRVASVLMVMVLSFALLAAVGWALSNQWMDILVHLPDYRANIHGKIEAIRAPDSSGLSRASATVNDLSKGLSAASETAANKKLNQKGAWFCWAL